MTDTQNRDDLELVRRCQEGDRRALKQLYVRHHGYLYAIVLRLTGRVEDAEDVVQETFIKAWKAMPSFRAETSFFNWLVRIGINLTRNLHRSKRKTVALTDREAPLQDSDALAQKWLDEALNKLPEGYREVLVLHDVMEFRHAEIAEILGSSVGTSKSQLHRARLKMRSYLLASRAGTSAAKPRRLRRQM